ncbi:unnamed protein product, partial [Rotaria magnacalcarata]
MDKCTLIKFNLPIVGAHGDIDDFVALFINNLSTLLAVILTLQPILGDQIIY